MTREIEVPVFVGDEPEVGVEVEVVVEPVAPAPARIALDRYVRLRARTFGLPGFIRRYGGRPIKHSVAEWDELLKKFLRTEVRS